MKLFIFSVNYETRKSTYKAVITGDSREDVVGYMAARFGNEEGYQLTSIEQREEVHALTDKVLEVIRGPKVDPEVLTETKLICPWCESENYSNFHALKMHIVKSHTAPKDSTPKKRPSTKGRRSLAKKEEK